MSALKNLTSLKRSITRRVREALQELQENLGNLGNLERAPVPVRIPVPVRGPGPFQGRNPRSFFRALGGCGGISAWANAGSFYRGASFASFHGPRGFQYQASRFFTTYNKFGGYNSWKWARINQSVIFHNFSSKSQFRSKSFERFYRTPTLTQLLKKKSDAYDEKLPFRGITTTMAALPKRSVVPTALRLNLSLTQKFHDVVMDLARPKSPQPQTSSNGCYVDFKLEPRILIPSTTMMNGDIMRELLANLKRFERHVADLQQDLVRLSELGELPLKFVASENVIRVFFPNCDRAQLECLLLEKNVLGGTIHEDVANHCEKLRDDDSVTSISEFDILSSANSVSSASSSSVNDDYDDVLSSSEGSCNDKIVHLEPVTLSGHVEFADDYYWA
ncbi:hypothetical protein JCM33374_g4440 [Metschnikowia sp. JCM 33374]|nr:hypothetical protein JCM33374_g4440 [Metschnikowia sp. JCM 33374]